MLFQICNLQELRFITDLYLLVHTHIELKAIHYKNKSKCSNGVSTKTAAKIDPIWWFDAKRGGWNGMRREDINEMFASQMILKIKCNTKNANHKKIRYRETYPPGDERHMCCNRSSNTNNNDNQNGNSQCKHKNSILYANDRKVIKS